jgi:acyl-coenzyme A thioesterase PaaI-like protein
MTLAEMVEAARDSGDLSPLRDAIPYAKFMGITAELMAGELLGKMAYDDKLIGNPILPALHGGTTGAFLEMTAIYTLLWESEGSVQLPKTINITIEYLRSARPVDTYAKAVITKQGRRVANVQVEAWQSDRAKPVASANALFLLADEA